MPKIKNMDYLKKYHKSVLRSLKKLGNQIDMEICDIKINESYGKKVEIRTSFSSKGACND